MFTDLSIVLIFWVKPSLRKILLVGRFSSRMENLQNLVQGQFTAVLWSK
jgi:hypothetical protein